MARPAHITGDQLLKLHQRLLKNDPTAPSELGALVFDLLLKQVAESPAGRKHPDLVPDAVSDALMSYLKRPTQFDPAKRALWGFLTMAVEGDLANAIQSQRRARQRENKAADVADADPVRNKPMASSATAIATKGAEFMALVRESNDLVAQRFPQGQDREIIELIMRGVSDTDTFARVMGIANRPVAEQRLLVKRRKDRLMRALRRLGEDQHG